MTERLYYIKAELSDIEEKWLCSTCCWNFYRVRPILLTMTESQFKTRGEHARCGECGV